MKAAGHFVGRGTGATGKARRLIARRFHRRVSRDATELATECEAFLSGRYLDWLSDHGKPAPGWAWVNALAHGSPDQVASCVGGRDERDGPSQVASDLALVIQATVNATGVPLATLQRSTLIPLESRLKAMFGATSPRGKWELAEWMRAALDQCPAPPPSGL